MLKLRCERIGHRGVEGFEYRIEAQDRLAALGVVFDQLLGVQCQSRSMHLSQLLGDQAFVNRQVLSKIRLTLKIIQRAGLLTSLPTFDQVLWQFIEHRLSFLSSMRHLKS